MKLSVHSPAISQKNNLGLQIIASIKNINTNSLATIEFPIQKELLNKKLIIIGAKVTRTLGILSECVCILKQKDFFIKDISDPINSLGAGNESKVILFTEQPSLSEKTNLEFEIKKINGCEASIDIEIYGLAS